MNYRQIVAVTGMGGLYQLMSTKKDGAIVRSLEDKSIKFIAARVHQVTPLESIEIYTYEDNVRLHTVLENIKSFDAELQAANIAKADSKTLREYFKKALPEFDEERVYTSDIKKIFKWYDILKQNDLLNFEMYAEKEEEQQEAVEEAEITEEKPTKKATKKVAVNDAEVATNEEKPKKAPAKKTVKKTAETSEEKPAKKTAKKKAE